MVFYDDNLYTFTYVCVCARIRENSIYNTRTCEIFVNKTKINTPETCVLFPESFDGMYNHRAASNICIYVLLYKYYLRIQLYSYIMIA